MAVALNSAIIYLENKIANLNKKKNTRRDIITIDLLKFFELCIREMNSVHYFDNLKYLIINLINDGQKYANAVIINI
jgi:hypothetical protein